MVRVGMGGVGGRGRCRRAWRQGDWETGRLGIPTTRPRGDGVDEKDEETLRLGVGERLSGAFEAFAKDLHQGGHGTLLLVEEFFVLAGEGGENISSHERVELV